MERNPNIDFPEGSQRFDPSERLERQIQLRGGPFAAKIGEVLDAKQMSMNMVDEPRGSNLAGVTMRTMDRSASLEDVQADQQSILLQRFLDSSDIDSNEPASGIYFWGDAPKERSLGTLAHESIHASSDLMSEAKVGAIESMFSRTLDDLIEASPYTVTSYGHEKARKKYGGKTFGEFAVLHLNDNIENLLWEAAREEEENYIRDVEGHYTRVRQPSKELLIGQAEDMEVRVARWLRDAETAELPDKQLLIPKLSALQKKIRKFQGDIVTNGVPEKKPEGEY